MHLSLSKTGKSYVSYFSSFTLPSQCKFTTESISIFHCRYSTYRYPIQIQHMHIQSHFFFLTAKFHDHSFMWLFSCKSCTFQRCFQNFFLQFFVELHIDIFLLICITSFKNAVYASCVSPCVSSDLSAIISVSRFGTYTSSFVFAFASATCLEHASRSKNNGFMLLSISSIFFRIII